MGSQLYWNMNQANPFSGEVPRVPPPPLIGNIEREMSSPALPPDSTTRGRSLSASSEVELSRCLACPSPGLVPPSGMVSHVVSCHRGQGFQCAACRHVDVNTSLLGYEELKEHIRHAHKVTSEVLMPTAIILPESLVQWGCQLCGGDMVFLREDVVKDHILTVHGSFYHKKAKQYSVPSCRLCKFDNNGGGLAEHIAAAHPREDFADEEDEDDEAPNLEPLQPDLDQADANHHELNSSVRSVNTSFGSVSLSVRSDLYPGEKAGPSVHRSVSPAEPQVKMSPKSRSSSPDIVFEKEVIASKPKETRSKDTTIKKERVRKKRKKSKSSSSSDSSSGSSDEEKNKKLEKKSKWVTDIDKYLSAKKAASPDKMNRSPSSSPSPLSRNNSKSEQRKRSEGEVPSSPEYLAPCSPVSPSQPKRRSGTPKAYKTPARSRTRVYSGDIRGRSRSRSRTRVYSGDIRGRYRSPRVTRSRSRSRVCSEYIRGRYRSQRVSRSRSRSPKPSSFKPSYNTRPPRRSKSKTPPRRLSETSTVKSIRSPSNRTKTPSRTFSKSPSRLSPERSHSRSASGQAPQGVRRRDDKVHCSVCNIDCDNSTQFNQHKLGQRHKQAAAKAGLSPPLVSFSFAPRPEASFGKIHCAACKSAFDERHYHCDTCQVHSLSKVSHDQHKEGKRHKSNLEGLKTIETIQIKSPVKFHQTPKAAAPGLAHCPSCDKTFYDQREVECHVRQVHQIFITCKECKVLKQLPAFEALTCTELIEHLTSDHHKTNIVEHDLKYYGEVQNWKQGYIKCNLCPPLKLGNVGLWFENEVKLEKMKNHFKTYHSKHLFNASTYLTLGCQLCSKTFTTDNMSTWLSHLASHQLVQPAAVQAQADVNDFYNPGKGGTGSGTTSTCQYCSSKIVQANEQEHVKSQHLQLTFSCKLCPVADRFLYKDYDDILRHLKLKHNGNNPHQNIIFPGDMKNLSNFAWVKCKTCDFKGLGLGKEAMKHLAEKHKRGGLQDFNIFCRICDKDERSIYNYDDAEDFADHMHTGHDGIIKHLPAKGWQRGADLGVGV